MPWKDALFKILCELILYELIKNIFYMKLVIVRKNERIFTL